MRHVQRIEICGGIAAGKTTLAAVLNDDNCQAILEDYESNPFWHLFFQNPDKCAFETELTFLLQHYHALKLSSRENTIVCDYSFIQDAAYAQIDLVDSKLAIFQAVHNEIMNELGPPCLLIHLTCTIEDQIARIKARNRAGEAYITTEFLERLNDTISQRVAETRLSVETLSLNSSVINFANNTSLKREIIERMKIAATSGWKPDKTYGP